MIQDVPIGRAVSIRHVLPATPEEAFAFPMRVTYHFEEPADATRAKLRVQGDVSTFYQLAGPLLALMSW